MQRYESYKPSTIPWVGELPQHWGEEKGKWLHCFRKDLNNRMQCDNVLSLTLRGVVNNDPDDPEGLVPKDYGTYQIFEKDDLVFKLIDLENFKTSRVGLVHERGIMSPAYLRVQPAKEHNPRYFYYYYFTLYQQGIYNKLGAGVRSTLGPTDLLDIGVPIPTRDEQDRIVAFLDQKIAEIDAAVVKKERLIELLNEQKEIAFDNILYGQGNGPSTLEGAQGQFFPKLGRDINLIQLGRVCRKIADGPHFSPPYVDAENGYLFLSAGNIRPNKFLLDDVKYVSERHFYEFCKRVRPEHGDVLYTKGGTTGVAKAVDIETPFQVWVHIAVLKLRYELVTPKYLAYALNSSGCYAQSQLFTRGATNKDLGLTRMKNIYLPICSLSEQEAVVSKLDRLNDQFNKAEENIRSEITILADLKTGLIASAVTGGLKI